MSYNWGRTMSEDKPARLPNAQHDLMGKPYAWVDGNSRIQSKQIDPLVDIPLYTKQEWQGLTDDEVNEVYAAGDAYRIRIVRLIEAKLKEKNGG